MAIQPISNDETLRSNAILDLKVFNFQSVALQAKKEEQVVSAMLSFGKTSDRMGDNVAERATENETLKYRLLPQEEIETIKSKPLNRVEREIEKRQLKL